MTRLALFVATLGLGSLVGCGDPNAESVATERAPIVNGVLSTSAEDAVVSLSALGAGCTGTLIAPNVVLTALHCVADYDPGFRFNCQPDGTLPPGSTVGQVGATVDPKNVSVRVGVEIGTDVVRGTAIYGTGSTDACHDDLAVVVLERAPDIGGAPLVALRFARPTRKGEATRIVGYGDVEQTATDRGRQVRKNLTVRGVGRLDESSSGDVGVLPRTLQIGEGPCHGDSGGPVFSQETGAQIGVYSLLNANTCTGADVRNTYTLIAPFESLIRTALESAGVEPIVEPAEETGSGGEAGATSVPTGGGSGGAGGPVGEAGAADDPGDGSGSFRHSSGCTFGAEGRPQRGSWLFVSTALFFAVGRAARRRTRARATEPRA
jgi:hypothetical protein